MADVGVYSTMKPDFPLSLKSENPRMTQAWVYSFATCSSAHPYHKQQMAENIPMRIERMSQTRTYTPTAHNVPQKDLNDTTLNISLLVANKMIHARMYPCPSANPFFPKRPQRCRSFDESPSSSFCGSVKLILKIGR